MKIAVMFGGTSAERDVSIASAAQIIPVLRECGHVVHAIDAATGRLSAAEERRLLAAAVAPIPPATHDLATLRSRALALSARSFDVQDVDLVFLAMHGGMGEDGRMQALLDLAGIPYTGSNHVASSAAMDKDLAKRLFRSAGVPTADWLMSPTTTDAVARALGWPVVVKPNKQGSTVGLSVVDGPARLEAAIAQAHAFDDEVMIERFVRGREFTVGILDGEALPPGEIIAPGEIFDYASKYQRGGAREVFPAEISANEAVTLRALSLKAHRALKLGSYSRVDFRRDVDGAFWCLEVNALPGLTATSLLPQAAAAAGIHMPELLDRICRGAIRR